MCAIIHTDGFFPALFLCSKLLVSLISSYKCSQLIHFVLQPTEFFQGNLCNRGLEVSHLMLLGSALGRLLKAIFPFSQYILVRPLASKTDCSLTGPILSKTNVCNGYFDHQNSRHLIKANIQS